MKSLISILALASMMLCAGAQQLGQYVRGYTNFVGLVSSAPQAVYKYAIVDYQGIFHWYPTSTTATNTNSVFASIYTPSLGRWIKVSETPDAQALLTTKGDLITRSGTTVLRLPAGNDGEFLFSNSNEGTGLRWSTFVGSYSSVDFPNISANSSQDMVVSASGAAAGDAVSIGLPSTFPTGLMVIGFVTANNIVTLRCFNLTGSPINPAAMNIRVVLPNRFY